MAPRAGVHVAAVGNHGIKGQQKATNKIKSGFISSAVSNMVVTAIRVCGPSPRIFLSGVNSFVLFPGWQLGEVQLHYAVIFICIFETSGGMTYIQKETKGSDF